MWTASARDHPNLNAVGDDPDQPAATTAARSARWSSKDFEVDIRRRARICRGSARERARAPSRPSSSTPTRRNPRAAATRQSIPKQALMCRS